MVGRRCCAAGYDGRAAAAAPIFPLATSSPMNLMHTSEVWPILRLLHQTLSHRILADVLPLLRVTLAVTQTMMKAARLKRAGVRMHFGKAIFPEPNPTFDGELQVVRGAEQMQVIRHQQVIAHQPGRGRVPPDVMERVLDGCLGEPTFAFFRADGEENPIGSAERNVNAFCRCAAVGRAALPRRRVPPQRPAHQSRFRVGHEEIRNGKSVREEDFYGLAAGRALMRRQRSGSSALPGFWFDERRGGAAAPPYRILNLGNKKAPDGSGAWMKTN